MLQRAWQSLFWILMGVGVSAIFLSGFQWYLLRRGPVLPPVKIPSPEPPESTKQSPEVESWKPVDKFIMVRRKQSLDRSPARPTESSIKRLSSSDIQKIEQTNLPFELIGTTTGSFEYAVLRNLDSRKTRQLRTGDQWGALQLKNVEDEWVRIRNRKRGKDELIKLRRSKRSLYDRESSQSSATRVSRFQINQAIHNNMNNLLAAVEAHPVLNQGTIVGFRITNFRGKPGKLLKKLGFREGDIIQRVNGRKINSMEKAMQLWTQMKNKKDFRIQILREGNQQTLEYSLVR